MRWFVLILVALVATPMASLSLASPVAFAKGEQNQGADVGTDPNAVATPAPEIQASVTPSPSAKTTATPTSDPTAPRAEDPVATTTADSASRPTIASDLADYPPGGTVTLIGAGWKAGEVVTIIVNDTGGLSWKLTREVVADAGGRITLTFNLPDRYVPDYDVTATGELSGVATTSFTDGPANGDWRYWMSAPNPAVGSINAGATITYVLNAQKTSWGNTPVAGATMTLTLSGNATFTSISGVGGDDGSVEGINTKTVTWSGMNLSGAWGTNETRTVTVTATVDVAAPAGSVMATTGDENDPRGTAYTGGLGSTTHTVIPATAGSCSFAPVGSGEFSRSICWFDLTGYNAAMAATTAGQPMQQNLLNGYVLYYTITATGTTDLTAEDLPTYSAAFLGNKGVGYSNNYQGIPGNPALYQNSAGQTVLTLSNIHLRKGGVDVRGFALVGADAESTDSKESITWQSDTGLTSIGALGNSCGGALVLTGTTEAKCNPGPVDNKTGAAILYTLDPPSFTQTMVGSGKQAVAFGVMVAGLQLNKQVVNQLPGDQFRISVARSDGTVAATALTDLVTGLASTEQVNTITSGSSQTFTLSEAPVGITDPANYATTWACTKNRTSFTRTGTSVTVDVTLNDFVVCTITNTGPALTLSKAVDNGAGGTLAPANWTLTATKSGSAAAIAQMPSLSSTTTGNVTTASTAKVPVPAGEYTLGESSADPGSARYAGSPWTCTNAGTGSYALVGNKVTLAPGNNLTCTIINTYVPNVTLRNTWVDGVNGDKADLVINNAVTSPGKATSTSNGTVGSWTDATSLATATPAVGSTVSIAEILQATNKGTYYTSAVVCVKGNNTVVPVAAGVFTMPNSNVTCDYSNRPLVGTVTWSKVDAGRTTTLLAGSEWAITGPSYPSPGIAVADCTSSPCSGPDTDTAVGRFRVTVRCGSCALIETKSPVGFQLDANPHTFAILTDGSTFAFAPIENRRVAVPAIPLTGGSSTDSYLSSGLALLLLAVAAAWHQRRRRFPHPRA